MANENSNTIDGSNMRTRFSSIEELYNYQNGLPYPFATVTPVVPIDNLSVQSPLNTSFLGNVFDPLMLDYDDGKEQLKDLERDEYFLFKVFLNPDGAELIKRYQNDSSFQKYPNVDIFIYYEWTDKYDIAGTICFVHLSKQLSDFIHSGSKYRSPATVAKKIADNYNKKKDQPYHDEITPKLIEEAITFQREKGKLINIVKGASNKILAEICFFAAKQIRKGKYNEKIWKNPTDKNYSPLIKVAQLETLKKALQKIEENISSFRKTTEKLGKQAAKVGFNEAAKLINNIAAIASEFEKSIQSLVKLIELGQGAIAIINAILCGAVNALIEMVAGLAELIGIIFSLDDEINKKLIYESIENAIQLFRQRSFIDFINEQIETIKDRYNSRELSNTEIAYNAGEGIVEVAMLAAIVRDVIVLIRKIPQLAEFTKTAEKVLKKEAVREIEAANKGLDYLLKKLYPKEPSKARRIKDGFEIDLFQKKGDEVIQVWYKDQKVFEGEAKQTKEYLEMLGSKTNANRVNILEEAKELNVIDEVMKKNNIKSNVPENKLRQYGAERKTEDKLYKIRNQSKSKKFISDKKALSELGIKIPTSKNRLSPDFANTPFLYPVKGIEKNIVKIKLTGSKLADKKIADILGGFKRTPKDYSWHHLDDYNPVNNTCTMQLVETSIHRKCSPHVGAVKIVEEYHNIKYLNR